MPAALQPRRKTFKVNLISFSFHSATKKTRENDEEVFPFSLCTTRGEFAKGKAFFLLSVYYFCKKKKKKALRIWSEHT